MFVLILAAPNLSAVDAASPVPRLVPCFRPEAKTNLSVTFQLPGSQRSELGLYAKPCAEGDEASHPISAAKVKDEMGTEVTAMGKFGKTEVALTIKEVPGPDRLNPYQVVIHAPFLQDLSGTIDGTSFEVKWSPVNGGGGPPPDPAQPAPMAAFYKMTMAGPKVESVALSATELMVLPHDTRLAFDIEPASESGSDAWIRLRAMGPEGADPETLRFQVVNDPEGNLGMPEIAESEVRAACAPYLPNSVEKSCKVQVLKRPSGDVYYCILGNAFPTTPTVGTPDTRYLFLGVFRLRRNVAFAVGNLGARDDTDLRLMLESLGRISAFPMTNGPNIPVPLPGKVADNK